MCKPPRTKDTAPTDAPIDGTKGGLAAMSSNRHYRTNIYNRMKHQEHLCNMNQSIPSDKYGNEKHLVGNGK